MQFGLRTVLALPIAWLLALLLAAFLEGVKPGVGSRRYARYGEASSVVRDIRLWAVNYRSEIKGNLPFSDYDTTELLSKLDTKADPWGNPYHFVDLEQQGEFGVGSRFHAYSGGEDGITHSYGNDPDDINSWDPKSHSRNLVRLNEESRTAMYFRTIWLTPAVCGGWLFCYRHRRCPSRRVTMTSTGRHGAITNGQSNRRPR